MTDSLLRAVSRLDQDTRSLLDEVGAWTPQQLQFRPSEESWSILNVIDHLVLSERAVLVTMKRHLSEHHTVTLRDRCRSAMVLGIMLSPVRVKVPDSVKDILPGQTNPELQSLRTIWAADRAALCEFLKRLSAADRQRGVFRHPVGGWTTASGAVLFLRLHFSHHLRQFRRLRRKLALASREA